MNRMIKVLLAASASAFCLFYAIQNIVNLGQAFWFVQTMVGMVGHEAYPASIIPAIESTAIIWIMLWIIIILEFTAGALAGKGAFDLFKARNGSADEFNNAKTFALAGTGLAVFIWFGIFSAVGGALFQMWHSALADASIFSLQHGVIWLLLRSKD
jgi:predicted small integral membrane protein